MNSFLINNVRTILENQSSLKLFRSSFCNIMLLNKKYYCNHHKIKNYEEVDKGHSLANIKQSTNPMVIKFNKLLKDMDNDENLDKVDKVYFTDFGSIRFDSDNSPTSDEDVSIGSNLNKLNYIDESYFEKIEDDIDIKASSSLTISNKKLEDLQFIDDQFIKYEDTGNITEEMMRPCMVNTEKETSDMNVVDDLYFNSMSHTEPLSHSTTSKEPNSHSRTFNESLSHHKGIENLKVCNFHECLMEESTNDSTNFISNSSKSVIDSSVLKDKFYNLYDKASTINTNLKSRTKIIIESHSEINSSNEITVLSPPETKENSSNIPGKNVKQSISKDENDNNLKNALNFVKEKRKQESEKDKLKLEKYKRILLEVPNFNHILRYEMISILKANILYNDHDIIGLNKPYGIPTHGGGVGNGKHNPKFNLVDLLPDLALRLKIEKLYPIHRLDINTTGVLVFAKNEAMATKLKALFKNRQIRKKYACICKGIPVPSKGVINIPISEGKIENIRRMVLRPDVPGFRAKIGHSKQAITKYKVISYGKSCSFVELRPSTGVKHQLRVHLGFGLDCPILGDHKYTHLEKMVPQKLSSDILDCLDLKQSRVRDLPIFLHSTSVSIPEILPIRDISIKAPLPRYFSAALKYLKLSKNRDKAINPDKEDIFED